MASLVKSSKTRLYASFTILLVDGDSTSLTIISKMLRYLGYKVMTAKRACDAFCIIRDQEHKIDFVLAEARLPDMDKYELLETMTNMTRLPVILMSVDYNAKDVLGCLFKGAFLYLAKPITMDDLKNLWQFAYIKEGENVLNVKDISCIKEALSMTSATDIDKGQNLRNEKRKSSYNDIANSATLKKPKLVWTDELHNRFLQAIEIIGIEEAHPKKIHQLMNVPGLKKINVASHLQKYRLSLKRQRDAAIQENMNIGSAIVQDASNNDLSKLGPEEGFHHLSAMQTMSGTEQQDVNSGLSQENLNGSMPIPSSVSTYLLEHADSNH